MCCVALPCCLLDLACFFISSFSSLIKHVIAESFIHVSYMEYVHVVMLLHFCPPFKMCMLVVSVLSLHRLRSVSLFQSDRPYPFTLGQHQSLVHYLMTSCLGIYHKHKPSKTHHMTRHMTRHNSLLPHSHSIGARRELCTE